MSADPAPRHYPRRDPFTRHALHRSLLVESLEDRLLLYGVTDQPPVQQPEAAMIGTAVAGQTLGGQQQLVQQPSGARSGPSQSGPSQSGGTPTGGACTQPTAGSAPTQGEQANVGPQAFDAVFNKLGGLVPNNNHAAGAKVTSTGATR